jgi:hypothetical protein
MANISELSVLIKANTKQASQQMKGFGQSMGSVFSKMKVGIMAVGVAVTGFAVKSVKQFIEVGDMLGKMSGRTGIAVETLDDLRIALDLSGTSIQGFEKGMRTLIMRVDDARGGITDYVNAFARIGIGVQDLEGLKPDEVFMLVAEGLAGLTTEMDKQQVAIDLLGGKFGTALLPALANGEEAFRDLLKEAGAMSTWTSEESKLAEDLADDFTELSTQWDEFAKATAVHIVPALIDTVTWMNEWIDTLEDLDEGGKTGDAAIRKLSKGISGFVASGVALQKQSDWLFNKYWKVLETTTEKTERLMDINVKLYKFFEHEGIISTRKLTDGLEDLRQRGLNLTNIAVEELTTNFAYVPTLFSDIDDAQDSLNEAMGGIANVVREQEKAVESATKSWIDYHMAIGMFQPIKDAGLPGSIEERMPSMMSPEGQMELWKGVMGLPSVGGDPAKAHAWLNSSKNPFNAGGWNAFNFPTTSGSSNVVLTNLAQINAGLKEAKVQGSQ